MHELGYALKLAHPTELTVGVELNYPCMMQSKKVNPGYREHITNVDRGSLIEKWRNVTNENKE